MGIYHNSLLILATIALLPLADAKFSFSTKLARLGEKFLSRSDPAKMLASGSAITSLYVGSTGIWFRSDTIAAINQLERGKKEEAMESLRLAIATLAVFDVTQATVQPIASVLINKMIKAKGFFPNTFTRLTNYKNALPDAMLKSGNSADDVLDTMLPLKERVKQAFDSEVTSFLKKSQGYDDLVTSLKNAKSWAKVAKWADVIGGPIFDSAMVAFSGYQLYLAITDKQSAPESKALAITSASLGIASGVVGIASFAVGALATAGTTLAAVAGPIGAIIGLLLGFTAIIVDLVNSVNPYNTIKQQLETLDKLKTQSLKYLDTPVNIAKDFTPQGLNTGFDTIYVTNQAAMLDFAGARSGPYQPWKGLDSDQTAVVFKAKDATKTEGEYLVKGEQRVFDKSKYRNLFFKPSGIVSIGYEFYGKKVQSKATSGKNNGLTVRVNTALIEDTYYHQGADVDTTVENDDVEKPADNVIIGYFSSPGISDRVLKVKTGAGNDVLQLTGLVCARDWADYYCLNANLGTGIDTFSLRGMDTKILDYERHKSKNLKVIGFRFKMLRHKDGDGDFFLRLDNEWEKHKGLVVGVNVFYGSPLDDVLEMGEYQNKVIKELEGSNEYIVHLEGRRRGSVYIHTIEDDSDRTATITFNLDEISGRFTKENVRFSKEASTIIVYNRRGRGIAWGKIILKRKDGDVGKHFKIKIPSTKLSTGWTGYLEELFGNEVGTHDGFAVRGDNRIVYGVPYKYFMKKSLEIYRQDDCSFFLLDINPPDEEPSSGTSKYTLYFHIRNSFIKLSDTLMAKLEEENYRFYYVSERTRRDYLLFEKRQSESSQEYIYRIELVLEGSSSPKAVLYGNMGSQKLLLDVRNNKQSGRLDLYKAWKSLDTRSERPYRFNQDKRADHSLLLGVPTKKPTTVEFWVDFKRWNEGRNSVVVSDSIFSSINEAAGGTFKIEFAPVKNAWEIDVSKRASNKWQSIHSVRLMEATDLVYEQGLVRIHLKSLLLEEDSKKFDLYEVMSSALANFKNIPMSLSDTYTRECGFYIEGLD